MKHVLGFAKEIKAGAIIHLGDWNNLSAIETVINSGIPVYAVLGNADIDPEIAVLLSKKAKMFNERWLMINLRGKKIGVVHNLTIDHQPLTIDCDIVFCGHTHKQEEKLVDGIKVVNPGAMENNIFFAVYDTEINGVELMNI